MRKLTALFALCLLFVCCLAFPLSARADVIYDPVGDFIATYSVPGIALLVLIGGAVVITVLLLLLRKYRK